MKILLIPQRLELATAAIDFNHGFGYLCSVLRKEGHSVNILDTDPSLIDREGIKKRIREEDCDVIGIGGLCVGFNSIEWMMEYIREERPEIPIILGGGIMTASPELIFNHLLPDFGVIGEGEETIVDLVWCLEEYGNPEAVKGIMYHKNGPFFTDPRPPIEDLNSLPWPTWDDFDVESIIQRAHPDYRRFSILASRSCPFSCTFCFHTMGNKYRRRSPLSVVTEMKELISRYDIDYFRFSDDLFAYQEKWITEFSKMVIRAKLNIRWECNGKPGYTCESALPLMKESGCINVGHGFETGSDKILKSMNKKATIKGAKETIGMYRKAGIGVSGAFIIGDPQETRETFRETVDFIKETNLYVTWMGYMTPFPGSQIYRDAVKKGLITDEIQFHRDVWNTQSLMINFTDIPDDELIKMKEDGIDEIRKHLGLDNTEEIPMIDLGRVLVTPTGEVARRILKRLDLDIIGFLDGDRSKAKRDFQGYQVFHRSREVIEELKPDYIVVVASLGLRGVIVKDLVGCGFPERKIVYVHTEE